MANSTGQLDALIEKKVDKKIFEFSQSIREQIEKFLIDNGAGNYKGNLYFVEGHELQNSMFVPKGYKYMGTYQITDDLVCSLKKTIKDKMIEKESKELLDKVKLLG